MTSLLATRIKEKALSSFLLLGPIKFIVPKDVKDVKKAIPEESQRSAYYRPRVGYDPVR
jgi:hypothetical protein